MKHDPRSEFSANDELVKAADDRRHLEDQIQLLRASRQTHYTKPESFVVRKQSSFLVDAALALLAGFLLSVPFLMWAEIFVK